MICLDLSEFRDNRKFQSKETYLFHMDAAIERSLSDKPYVKGFLCADSNGLLLCAKGELSLGNSGRYTAISREAAAIHPHLPHPVVTIETSDRKIIVKDYSSQTVVIRCSEE